MKVWNITRLVALGALALVALGCGSGRSTPPLTDERPANELTFLRPATGAPQFADTTVRFYAKGDGDIDADDRRAEPLLAVWRQEAPGQPWLKLTSNVEIELDEIEADLTGFSGYALAY
jgi:hypothetical protein